MGNSITAFGWLAVRVAGFRTGSWRRALSFVRDHAGGVLSSAAVPRVCLGQTAPPLCRCAEYTTGLILQAWWVLHRQYRHRLSRVVGVPASVQTRSFQRGVSCTTARPPSSPPRRLVCTAQRHKGGAVGPRPTRGTAAQPYTPSAWAYTLPTRTTETQP